MLCLLQLPPACDWCPNDGTVRQLPQESAPRTASDLGLVLGPQSELLFELPAKILTVW